MRKIVKWVYACAILGVMLYAVVGLGSQNGFQNVHEIAGEIQSLFQNGVSGLHSAASDAASSWQNAVSGRQPIPTTQGAISAPSQDAAPAQTTAAPSGDFAQTGMQGLSVYTYGRTLLTASERAAYDQIQTGLVAVQTKITVNSTVSPTDMQKVVQYVISDHPEAFYLNGTSMAYTGAGGSNSRRYTISFSYLYSADTIASMREKLREAVLPMLAKANTKTDPVKKELALHNALVEKCAYSTEAADNPSSYPQAFTAYGALVDGSAVCEGYAKALKLLLDSAGLHSLYVTGMANSGGESGPHAWNMVYVGKWYQVDATFDDPVYQTASGRYVQANHISYAYFNFVTKPDHVLGTFDSAKPFAADSENYVTMPTL